MLTPATAALAQSEALPYEELKLNSLKEFRSPTENWIVAGDVYMDLYTDNAVQTTPGVGVLVNTNQGKERQDIFTNWKHGDLDLELEFMMAKGSNSGIYLQGRYELQLLDSWGVEHPRFSDVGGVYQWWEDGKGVGGIAPRVNAARAPGLWQHLQVKFRAPRFNKQGEKIENARLVRVVLNGVVIHENIELVHPTGGAVSEAEVPMGPLRFQGDHGPVAFRNIRYKRYDAEPLRVRNITYSYYEGEFSGPVDINSESPVARGQVEELNVDVIPSTGRFAIVYEGKADVKEAGKYLFELRTDGGSRLTIDGKTVVANDADTRWWETKSGIVTLPAGTHDIELVYYRGEQGGNPALSLMVEGPGIKRHGLHAAGSFPESQPDLPMIVNPRQRPLVMRGFAEIDERVHPQSAAVGYPEGTHYAVDFNSGALMKIWKGAFLNLSTMWEGRGGGNLGINDAAAIILSGAPSLAMLESNDSPWPDTLRPQANYSFSDYRFEDNGAVVLNYSLLGMNIADRIVPADNGRVLTRSMIFSSNDARSKDVFLRVAAGRNISQLDNGLYQVDDKSYYIRLDGEHTRGARLRTTSGGQELIVPVPQREEATLSYSLIW
jgi:hypothetical protein